MLLRFWLDKGVDGFRVDVMWLMIKDDQYRDNPPNPHFSLGPILRQQLAAGIQLQSSGGARGCGRDAGRD